MLQSLPLDILEYLLDFVEDGKETLKTLKLVSKSFDSIVRPRLWRAIHMTHKGDAGACKHDYHFSVLATLSEEANNCAPYVRELTLICSPQSYTGEMINLDATTMRSFNAVLSAALRNCCGLEKFHYRNDVDFTLPATFDVLREAKHLRDLHIVLQSSEMARKLYATASTDSLHEALGFDLVDIYIPRFTTDLVHFSFAGLLGLPGTSMFNIAYVLAHCPQLRSLTMSVNYYSATKSKWLEAGECDEFEYYRGDILRDISVIYASYVKRDNLKGDDGLPRLLKLKTFRLDGGLTLTADAADDLPRMFDFRTLRGFRFRNDSTALAPVKPALTEDWMVLRPAEQLEDLYVFAVIEPVKLFFTASRVLTTLRKLEINACANTDLLALLLSVETGGPFPLTEFRQYRNSHDDNIAWSDETANVVAERFIHLEKLLFPVKRLPSNKDLPSRALVSSLGRLRHLKILVLCYGWPGTSRWRHTFQNQMAMERGAFIKLEYLTFLHNSSYKVVVDDTGTRTKRVFEWTKVMPRWGYRE